uniref:C2H2-type domain-containing protein n=1 Tax=Pavo cristatus TaxID=9049 RepID=A0A8C9G6M1_PAVCR
EYLLSSLGVIKTQQMQEKLSCSTFHCKHILMTLQCILEPLSLPESPANPDGVAAVESSPSVPCIFCEECYVLAEQNQLLKHMIIEHKLVVADVKLVADFKRYGIELFIS